MKKKSKWTGQMMRELAALVDADMPVLDALKSVSRNHAEISAVVPDMLSGLRREFQFGDVFLIAGAVSRQDAFLLNIAAQSGELPGVLRKIAQVHERREARVNRLRARLGMTKFVGLVVIAAGFVIDMSAGARFGPALSVAVLQMILILGFLMLLVRGVMLEPSTWLAWAWKLKLIHRRPRIQQLFEQYWYTILRWQLRAGISAAEAVSYSAEAIEAEAFCSAVESAATQLHAGCSFFDALTENGLIFSSELSQVIRAGEAAGRLEQSLEQYQELQELHMELAIDGLADWLPRLAYAAVIVLALNTIPFAAPGGYLE